MMRDLQELLQLIETAVANHNPIPRELLVSIMNVGIDQTQKVNPQATRAQCVEIFMTKVRERMRHDKEARRR